MWESGTGVYGQFDRRKVKEGPQEDAWVANGTLQRYPSPPLRSACGPHWSGGNTVFTRKPKVD